MAIDPSVYGRLAAPGTGLATLAELAEFKDQRADKQAARQVAEQKRQQEAMGLEQAQQREALVREAFQRNTSPDGVPNRKGVLGYVYQRDPFAGQALEAQFTKMAKEAAESVKAEQDNELRQMDADYAALQGATTPEAWSLARSRVTDPQLRQWLGETPDPQKIDYLNSARMAAKDYYTKIKDVDEKATTDTERVLGHLGLSKDAQHWADGWAEAVIRGVDDDLLAMGLTRDYSPEQTAHASELSLGPKEVSVIAGRQADDARMEASQAETERHNRVMEVRPTGATSPIAVIGEDGKPIFVRPDDAYGRTPASTREQGRPVTSGDANRIADYDTSMDDLVTLRATIAPRNEKGELVERGATGAMAQAGAAIPKFVTDLTGWGTTAKQKQAVIDRVKQVIGKALEGGVLRKEDEYKYEKILPTISDTVAVVESKLNGLEQSIRQRRQTLLDSLADAGYDIGRFQQRADAPADDAPKEGETRLMNNPRYPPNAEKTYIDGKWVRTR